MAQSLSTEAPTAMTLAEAVAAASDTRSVAIGAGIIGDTPQLFSQHFGSSPAVIIADANTHAVAGQIIQESFRAQRQPVLEPFVFGEPDLKAEHRFVEQLQATLDRHSAIPVAVGAGTLSDLTKLAAHRTNRPYMCVATAASMDGYTAFGASITRDGSKQTFLCPAPRAVLADIDILAAAPRPMTASGYADLLAKVTAGADWLFADALKAEPIHPQAWAIIQGRLPELVTNAAIAAGTRQAISGLIEGLLLAGFAMQTAKSSRPASGAEHQFSHLWDMEHHTCDGAAPSHGFKVGIGTLAVSALYEWLLRQPLEQLDVNACCAAWPDDAAWKRHIGQRFGSGQLAQVAQSETEAKHGTELVAQLTQLRSIWPSLRQRLRSQLLPFAVLKERLAAAGAPSEPEQIGITRQRLRDSYWKAYHIRRRFTVLDLAARAGLLEASLNELFGPGGPWPIDS